MKFLDKILQIWRIAKAKPFVPWGARVLDVGGYNGALLNLLPVDRLSCGIDPKAPPESRRMIPGCFPKDMPDVAPFDAITMLACLEHIPNEQLNEIKAGCAKFLQARRAPDHHGPFAPGGPDSDGSESSAHDRWSLF